MTATQWRRQGYPPPPDRFVARRVQPDDTLGSAPLMAITVESRPPTEVAYVRHLGPYAAKGDVFDGLFSELRARADSRGQLNLGSAGMTIIHDSPQITEKDRLRVGGSPPV